MKILKWKYRLIYEPQEMTYLDENGANNTIWCGVFVTNNIIELQNKISELKNINPDANYAIYKLYYDL